MSAAHKLPPLDGLAETPQFVHLRVHSAFSLLEGALPVKKVIAKAVADQQPAIGLTDTNNLFAALEFSKVASGEGLQPIIGAQLSIDFEDEQTEDRGRPQQRSVVAGQPFLYGGRGAGHDPYQAVLA